MKFGDISLVPRISELTENFGKGSILSEEEKTESSLWHGMIDIVNIFIICRSTISKFFNKFFPFFKLNANLARYFKLCVFIVHYSC
jgi:hypothetical protein